MDVLVVDQKEQTLHKALPQAMNLALIRMSGNAAIVTLPQVRQALQEADHYVSTYRYLMPESAKTGYTLRVVFDGDALKELLKQVGQLLWVGQRPLTLIWLALSEEPHSHHFEILTENSSHEAVRAISEAAQTRGLRILFPLMDLQDQAYTTSSLPNKEQLAAILARYGVSCVLAGALMSGNEGGLAGEWQLYFHGQRYEWQSSGQTVSQVITNTIDRMTEMLAAKSVVADINKIQQEVLLHVSGIQNLQDYVDVLADVKKLKPVMRAEVSDMTADTVVLKIQTAGGVSALQDALKKASSFSQVLYSQTKKMGEGEIFYRWRKTLLEVR